ncbi:MAG: O-antigen ligase family protein [Bacteroidota bacterium]
MLNLGLFLLLTGFFFSRFALSAGMAILVGCTIVQLCKKGIRHVELDRPLLVFISVFLLYLITGLYSEDQQFFTERIRIYLPFLILPFAFSLQILNKKKKWFLWLFYWLLLVSVTAVWSIIGFFSIYVDIGLFTENGTLLPTPINHVRYSLMVAFAILVGIHLFFNFGFKHWSGKFFILLLVSFLILYLHFLAVRSGILGFYLSMVFIGLREIVARKKIRHSILAVFVLAISLTSFRFIPSFKKKLQVTYQSISSILQKQEVANISDNGRMKSVEAGLHVGFTNLWTGVGAGDVKNEVIKYYQDHSPEWASRELLPHNQFVFVFAAAGLPGLLWFTFAVLYPLFYYRFWKYNLLMGFSLIMLSSFLFDHTLETQIGVGFYLVFQLILIRLAKLETSGDRNNL